MNRGNCRNIGNFEYRFVQQFVQQRHGKRVSASGNDITCDKQGNNEKPLNHAVFGLVERFLNSGDDGIRTDNTASAF